MPIFVDLLTIYLLICARRTFHFPGTTTISYVVVPTLICRTHSHPVFRRACFCSTNRRLLRPEQQDSRDAQQPHPQGKHCPRYVIEPPTTPTHTTTNACLHTLISISWTLLFAVAAGVAHPDRPAVCQNCWNSTLSPHAPCPCTALHATKCAMTIIMSNLGCVAVHRPSNGTSKRPTSTTGMSSIFENQG